MDKKVITGVFALLMILVVVGGLLIGNELVDGKKAIIIGTVSNNLVTGWSIEVSEYFIRDDGIFEVALWYLPWETKDILIFVEIEHAVTKEVYIGESWIGKANVIYSDKNYEVVVHYLPDGQYYGDIYVYEVDKGFVGLFEESRELKARTSLDITVD